MLALQEKIMAKSDRAIINEEKSINEFAYFNTALQALNVKAGRADLIALMKGYDWSVVDEKLFLKILKTRISTCKSFSIPTPAEILKSYNYNSYKNNLLLFVAAKWPKGFLSCNTFFNILDTIPSAQLSIDEKSYLTRSFYYCLSHPCEKDEITAFIGSSILLKKKIGVANFFALYNKQVINPAQSFLSYYIKICELIIKLPDIDAERIIQTHFPDLKALIKELETIDLIEMQKKIPEEKTEEIIDRWTRIDDFVKFPLFSDEVARLKKEYAAVEVEAKTLVSVSVTEFAKNAKDAAARLSSDPAQIYRLVAIVREAIYREFKNYPYPEQLISVLALLKSPEGMKGRVAKIRTGEGKSRIIAMLAALGALQNRCVDIITSNRYLAIRDQVQFAGFFRTLGVTSSHICYDQPEQKHFDHLILYATHHDIEFSILRDEIYDRQSRRTTVNGILMERPSQNILVDEVDVMLLDAQRNSARIAIDYPEKFSWVYFPLIQFIKKNTAGKVALLHEEIQTLKRKLTMPVIVDEFRVELTKLAPKTSENEFTDLAILKWLQSGIKALYELKIDQDYTIKTIQRMTDQGEVKTPQIIIIDSKVTGRSSGDNCRWQNGIHEILEIMNGISPGHESLTCAAISHFSLFERYECIGGLTGTVGSEVEREELRETYKVGSFDVPPRFPSHRVQLSPLYFATQEAYLAAMVEEVKRVKGEGRPILAIFSTIEESIQFAALLKFSEISVQVINEKQSEDEEYLISRAGRSGVVTVATYTAGRGTDIILSSDALVKGGLHVISGGFPTNERPEEQAFGRAGRQGQVGSCRMFICEQDKFIQSLLKNNSVEEKPVSLVGDKRFMEKLQVLRKKEVEIDSIGRRGLCRIDGLEHQMLKEFWRILRFYRQELNSIKIESLREICRNIPLSVPTTKTEKLRPETKEISVEKIPTWLTAFKEQAQILLMQQSKGSAIDWSVFLNNFKLQCTNMLLKKWAKFFTRLEDERIEHFDIYEKTLFKKFHQCISDDFGLVLSNPTSGFLSYLAYILGDSSKELLLKNEPTLKLPFFIAWENKIKAIYEASPAVILKFATLFQAVHSPESTEPVHKSHQVVLS